MSLEVLLPYYVSSKVTVAQEELAINRLERVDTNRYWLGWVDHNFSPLQGHLLVPAVRLKARAANDDWTVKRMAEMRYRMPDRQLVLFDVLTGAMVSRKWLNKNVRVPLARVA
jgi:hypothetical protein